MGREVNGVNAQVEKDLNVDRNREFTDDIHETVEEKASRQSQQSGVIKKEKASVVLE